MSKLRKIAVLLFWLIIWQLAAMLIDNEIMFVTPGQTFAALVGLCTKVTFWRTIGMSLCRIIIGFLGGMLVAFGLAAVSKRFPLAAEILAPVMTLCKAVPVAVFVVLLLIWWGSSVLAVAICFLIVLPNIYISTLEGLKNTDKKLLEMARVFELPLQTKFFYIYRPALKPFLSSSLKLSLGMCWKSGVAAEVIGTPDFSIGEQLYMSKIHLDTAGVFAWAVVIILLSVGFERLVLMLAEKFWKLEPACRGGMRTADLKDEASKEIHVESISKAYNGQPVLQNRNEIYKPGELYYLTSPSGSGKTTFFRILSGLEEADTGSVTLGLKYSMVFQEDRLCEEYSALRNVEMVTGNEKRAREALLQLLEESALEKPCSQLSGGMKRRVALVRAMESASHCVLLDEPFTGMDAATRMQAECYIRERQKGRILVIATHI